LKVGVSGPQPGGAPVLVDIGGLGVPGGDPVWNGSNQGGQWVANGVYYVKVSSTDPFGNTSTVTTPVNVVGVENQELVEVFNSAGEVVRKFDLSSLSSTAQNLTLSMSAGQSAVAATTDPLTGAVTGGVNLSLTMANGGTQNIYWDGLSANGGALQSGTYLIELVRSETGHSSTVKTVAVTLLQSKDTTADDVAASAKAEPDPVLKGDNVEVHYKPSPQDWAQAKLFNLSGELVGQSIDLAGRGILSFGNGLSGGVYVVDFEVLRNGAILARRILKVAVVR
ncbi:MAG TPA: hypothetical protein VNZ67_05065, partial [bacterium]|nr:hypothetical protein [bacterium]